MKIRSHLLLLVAGALLPLLVFSAGLTAFSWWQQRNSLELRQLERVRAMTIALDTELQASIRVMRVLGLSPQLSRDDLAAFADVMRGVLAAQPLWSMVAVGDPQWGAVVAVAPGGEMPQPPPVHSATRERVAASGLPGVSPLMREGDRHVTQIVVPVVRDGAVDLLVVVAIDQHAWLDFMSQYPVGSNALLTLIDQDGIIIARTLNNEATVGKPPAASVLERSRASAESAFRSVTLEGEEVYSAHSRSVRWGWTVATGIPARTVEESLRGSSYLMAGAALVSIVLAVLLAFLFGRRIERPVTLLGESALALERGEDPRHSDGRITEVQEVARAFEQAAARLHERQKALNEALAGEQRARREAEQASRAKDEFIAMLGHELRNPLNAITSAVAVLDHVEPASEQAQRAKDIIGRQMLGLRKLIDDLLDVARVTSGKIALDREVVDLGRIARRTVMVLSASARLGDHKLEVDCAEAWVEADETRIEQIVTNLVDNAAKYTPAGGRIGVRVHVEGDEAVLAVEDSGMGIAPELLPRIFDPFTQGERTIDRAQGGLGLGLALVRRVVELHGGRAFAESAGTGKGARFSVRLPRVAPPAREPRLATAQCERARTLRILIVEDNADGRETLAMMLGLQGHEVHEAENGPRGVERALALAPDAAIVDIGLPGFDGYEVARRVRSAPGGGAIRLVALTGYGQEDDRRNALAAGFDWFLVKPVDMGTLDSILACV